MNRDVVNIYLRYADFARAVQFNGVNVDIIRDFVGKKLSAFQSDGNLLFVQTNNRGFVAVNIGDYVVSVGVDFKGLLNKIYCFSEDDFHDTYQLFTEGEKIW